MGENRFGKQESRKHQSHRSRLCRSQSDVWTWYSDFVFLRLPLHTSAGHAGNLNLAQLTCAVCIFRRSALKSAMQKAVLSAPTDVTKGGGGTMPRALNHCGSAEKSQQCRKYFLHYHAFASERLQVRTWGRQTCFLPRAPYNIDTPCRRQIQHVARSHLHRFVAKRKQKHEGQKGQGFRLLADYAGAGKIKTANTRTTSSL